MPAKPHSLKPCYIKPVPLTSPAKSKTVILSVTLIHSKKNTNIHSVPPLSVLIKTTNILISLIPPAILT
ncbi:hypothetical protein THIOM_001849 [Candidatus Thiomargarita nelsonii]|uniref:Uncharacterized protein n=1 Tax=Candidatus Thiomargarita nelsonii TaxID=1003181 RepID=A0A176S2M7_9GAMM|nr:hypothetical protein THIOM_001849 [Candidatus Thiomargarita nelsonii]